MNKFTIFLKSGGGHGVFVRNTLLKLSKVFDSLSSKEYITPAIQAHIEVRVDGTIVSYKDPAGCSHLKYTKAKSLIAVTIAVKSGAVENEAVFKKYLSENIITAFNQMLDRLLKEKYEVDKTALIEDLAKQLDEYST